MAESSHLFALQLGGVFRTYFPQLQLLLHILRLPPNRVHKKI